MDRIELYQLGPELQYAVRRLADNEMISLEMKRTT